MPFLATMPITMIRPMNDATLKVVPVTRRAQDDAGDGEHRRSENGNRRREVAELGQKHAEDQRQRQHQHAAAGRGRIAAAAGRCRRTRRARMAAGAGRRPPAATLAITPPRFGSFEIGGDFDELLQVFARESRSAAATARLSASEPRVAVWPEALLKTVFSMASSELRCSSPRRTRMV